MLLKLACLFFDKISPVGKKKMCLSNWQGDLARTKIKGWVHGIGECARKSSPTFFVRASSECSASASNRGCAFRGRCSPLSLVGFAGCPLCYTLVGRQTAGQMDGLWVQWQIDVPFALLCILAVKFANMCDHSIFKLHIELG